LAHKEDAVWRPADYNPGLHLTIWTPLILMESRLNDLETRAAFQDELLETLNRIVAEQQQQLDLMQREIRLRVRADQDAVAVRH
jgi:uncharacterized coiled-coil protein SlyX